MPELANSSEIMSWIKIVMPWITGGLAGAILTLLVKIKSDRKRRKILAINTEIRKFSLETDSEDDIATKQGLKVSYLGREYHHLLLYSIKINNAGFGLLSNQNIVLLFSPEANILQEKINFSPLNISYTTKDIKTSNGIEKHFEISTLRAEDNTVISILVDSSSQNPIQVFPRPSEDVEVLINDLDRQDSFEGDVRRLLSFVALYVLASAFPVLSGALQACVIIWSIPTLMPVIKRLSYRRTALNIGPIRVDGGSHVEIHSE